jgi:hypothetical protein
VVAVSLRFHTVFSWYLSKMTSFLCSHMHLNHFHGWFNGSQWESLGSTVYKLPHPVHTSATPHHGPRVPPRRLSSGHTQCVHLPVLLSLFLSLLAGTPILPTCGRIQFHTHPSILCRALWLKNITLATQEAEIGMITSWGQPGQKVK